MIAEKLAMHTAASIEISDSYRSQDLEAFLNLSQKCTILTGTAEEIKKAKEHIQQIQHGVTNATLAALVKLGISLTDNDSYSSRNNDCAVS